MTVRFGFLLGPYLYFRVPIFSVLAPFTRRMSIQSATAFIQQWVNLIRLWWVLHCYYTYMYLQELVQGYTVGKFWFFSYAYALNFINHCFGSLFWLLGVPIGSLFHKKLGPFFKAWGSLLVRVTVHCLSERSDTIHSIHVTPHLLTCSKKLNVAEVACQLRSLLNNPPSPVQPFILKHFHQSQKYINVIQGGISALLGTHSPSPWRGAGAEVRLHLC